MEFHKVEKLKNLIDFKEETINAAVLLKENERMALLVAIKKEQIMPEHISDVNAFIYILKGKVKFSITEENQKEFIIEKGQSMFFKPNEKHTVLGLEDSKILVVRI